MADILKTLIEASEKAAGVARSCTATGAKTLLILEKDHHEANSRFDQDFKTIADVLAQESAKHVIVSKFPDMINDVRGEECSEIDGVSIHLKDTVDETTKLLSLLIPVETANELARAAHSTLNSTLCDNIPDDFPVINSSDLGIWIDPIDGTAEFIAGVKNNEGAYNRLLCVTVLIGAYLKSSGEPVMGVINQPFYNNGKGRIIWGFQYGDTFKWNKCYDKDAEQKIILMSAAEEAEIIEKFKNAGWQVVSIAGAGNKLMQVALGEATAYLVTKGTTFRWDTCAPHSVIKSKGGDIVNLKNFLPITYNDKQNLETKDYCNGDGIIAFTNKEDLQKIKDILF